MPLHIIRQDITKIPCDAIVNPTNSKLIPDGGTDRAIHTAAGPGLAKACAKFPGCETGQAVITPAFNLPCKYVIHTVGPVWKGGFSGEHACLESCYTQSLQLAKKFKCKSVAFPLISSGTYGYPKEQVLKVAMGVIGSFLREHELTVTIAVFDKDSYALSRELADEVNAYIDDRYTGDDGAPMLHKRCEQYNRKQQNRLAAAPVREDNAQVLYDAIEECISSEELAVPSLPAASHTVERETKKKTVSLDEMLRSMDKGFADTLFEYIDARGMDDVECYKRANIDRKTFSKIKCNKHYKPSKQTVLSFAIALRLTLEETNHLLNTVGMSLSRSSKFDVIIEYFITNGKYDIFEINETLFAFDQVLLGA